MQPQFTPHGASERAAPRTQSALARAGSLAIRLAAPLAAPMAVAAAAFLVIVLAGCGAALVFLLGRRARRHPD